MGYSIYVSDVTKYVRKKKRILNNVCLSIPQNSFTAIVGMSGAGKTTLLNLLSGYDTEYSGEILYHNFDLKINDLRSDISYVPQKEILHKDLTLWEELWYSAKLKIKNLSNSDLKERIKTIIDSLELNGLENVFIKNLSGGEQKRLSIAILLITKPKVLILDEPTSGLDLNIANKLMKLLKRISQDGTTIIISAHTVSDLKDCDQVVFMGQNGAICYVGKYTDSFSYFKVEDFVDIYELLKTKTDMYSKKYLKTFKKERRVLEKYVRKDDGVSFFTLVFYQVFRCFKIIWHDKLLLFLNLAVPVDGLMRYDSAKIVLFAVICASMWIGIFNSVQEIVKEKALVKQEYMANVHLSSYITSKIVVYLLIAIFQAISFMIVSLFHFETFQEGLLFSSIFLQYVLHFVVINFSSCMLGLFISTICKKREYTLLIVTIYMMAQLIFSGVLLPIEGMGKCIQIFILSKYAISGLGSTSNLIYVLENSTFHGVSPVLLFGEEAYDFFQYEMSFVIENIGILLLFALVFALLTFIIIKPIIKHFK